MMGRLAGLPGARARRRAAELLERFDLAEAGRPHGQRPGRAACAGASTWPPAWSASRR